MRVPLTVKPDDAVTPVGRILGTRLVVKGQTWLPFVEVVTWSIMAWYAHRQRPSRSWPKRVGIGALTTPIVLGSEWCHNLAHAAAAYLIGKPVDAIRIIWGMPRLVYFDIQDETVTPRQHILRALGGPVCNALLWIVATLFRRRTQPDSTARDVANAAVGINAFLCTVSLLPIPGIDGGPILKWSLVAYGRKPDDADRLVRKVNGVLGIVLAGGGLTALRVGRRVLGVLLTQFAALAFSIWLGLIREQ
jgi:Zn-dependent protease